MAALASDVDLLVLDEPTSGLDPLMESVFRDCIDEFRDEGHTVLLSSHILAEVEHLCDRVSIIRAGQVRRVGTLAELRHLTRTSITADLASVPDGLETLPGVHDVQIEETGSSFEVDTDPARRGAGRAAERRCAVAPEPATDARGALPAALRRPDRADEEAGDGDREPASSCARSCGETGGCYLWWGLGVALLYVQPGLERRRAVHHPGGVRPGRRRAWRERRAHRHGWSGPGAEHDRRPGDLAGGRLRGHLRRTDEHVHRRSAHPRRGGERTRRAAPRRAGRTVRRR